MADENNQQTEEEPHKAKFDVGEVGLKIAALYHLRDEEFCSSTSEKNSKIKTDVEAILKILPDPASCDESEISRAQLHYYIGKTWDAMPTYQKDAETHLSKAVKFNPSLHDAWLCLGHSYWKNNNLPRALDCLQTAVELAPQDKCALRELSRVLRLSGTEPEQRKENIKKSIEVAKKAVAVDLKDGLTWYILGNCYLSHFINTIDMSVLQQALKSFNQAISCGQTNPDLLFNQAVVFKYLGRLEEACVGFEAAFKIDPSLVAALESCLAVRQLVNTLHQKIQSKGGIPHRNLEKQLIALSPPGTTKVMDNMKVNLTFQPLKYFTSGQDKKEEDEGQQQNTNTKDKGGVGGVLSKGQQSGNRNRAALNCKVLNMCSTDGETPIYYVVIDKNQDLAVIVAFCVGPTALREGDDVWIPQPSIVHHDIAFDKFSSPGLLPSNLTTTIRELATKDSKYGFDLIKLENPMTMLVNGKLIPSERLLAPQMSVHAFT